MKCQICGERTKDFRLKLCEECWRQELQTRIGLAKWQVKRRSERIEALKAEVASLT